MGEHDHVLTKTDCDSAYSDQNCTTMSQYSVIVYGRQCFVLTVLFNFPVSY